MAEIQDKLIDIKGLDTYTESVDQKLRKKLDLPGGIARAGNVLTIDDDGEHRWKTPQVTSATVEATVRRIVNEQLAKMKYTINDQGHLIIETPEA